MKSLLLASTISAVALLAAIALGAQAAPRPESAEGARNGVTLLATNRLPQGEIRRMVEQDCAALSKDPGDPKLACEAVRCATGLSPSWSGCPAPTGRVQTAAAR